MQAAKRLTLRVKEDFFWLEYGATSETSKSGLLEEHIAQQTISTRFHLIKQQSLVGPISWMMTYLLIWSIFKAFYLELLMKNT